MQKAMKVHIKDFKCLKDFEANINGQNVLLMGDNEVGKSSFTQFLKIALGDTKHIPENTKGSGTVVTDRDGKEWIFTVKIENGKSKVEITSPDGLKDSRKGSLSSLIGAVDFDINEFVELSKNAAGRKKQVEIFKGFLDEDTRNGIATLEANIKAKYDNRTEINKDIKLMEGEIASHPLNAFSNEALGAMGHIDLQAVYSALKADEAINNRIKEVQGRLSERERELKGIEEEISRLTAKAEVLKKQNGEANAWLIANELKNIAIHEEKINAANETNKRYEAAQLLIKRRKQLEDAKMTSGELTAEIESHRFQISDWIKKVSTPVEGLTFEGDTLLYNGVVVSSDSLSTSQIEELGIRLKIAENPDFGILFIGKAESIGKERMKRILEIAKANNLQVIGEQVERQDEKRLHIELINENA